jgi:hypothetical protein
MQKIKRRIFYLFRKHYKIYTLLILIMGIVIGCGYEGKDNADCHYYHAFGNTFCFCHIIPVQNGAMK